MGRGKDSGQWSVTSGGMAEHVEIVGWGWGVLGSFIASYTDLEPKVRLSTPTWAAASRLIRSCEAMSRAESLHFVQMYTESQQRFSPLSDPLDLLFPLHRQLSSSREEVYSDWFQWVLGQIPNARTLGCILGSPSMELAVNSHEPIVVDREIPVEHGHAYQTGRLDIVVRQGTQWLAVVEVKTRPYEDADLEKHEGYRKSINSPETELIFLAVDPPDSDPRGFRFLSWADVCVTLRRIAPEMLKSRQILTTALILAFVGAVEQNLLGFTSPESPRFHFGKVPRMIDHFRKTTQMEAHRGEQ